MNVSCNYRNCLLFKEHFVPYNHFWSCTMLRRNLCYPMERQSENEKCPMWKASS